MAFLKSYLKANGLDPDHDVQIVPTGAGALAGQALANKNVQGLFYRGSVIAGLENNGSIFRSFSDPEWHRLPGYSMATLQSTIARDPKMLEGLVRGAAKASLFAATNPDCVVQSTMGELSRRPSRPASMTRPPPSGTGARSTSPSRP